MTFANESMSDRMIRILAAIILAVAAWATWPGAAAVAFLVLGAVALVTGLVGWCPLYTLFGVSTRTRAGA